MNAPPGGDDAGILAIERPHQDLLTCYVNSSFAAGPLFSVPLVYRVVCSLLLGEASLPHLHPIRQPDHA